MYIAEHEGKRSKRQPPGINGFYIRILAFIIAFLIESKEVTYQEQNQVLVFIH